MKKLIGFVLVIIIFAGIGFGVKRFVEGPSQPVNGIVVIGTEQEVNKVKALYKENTNQTTNYTLKLVTTKKMTPLSEEDQKETDQQFDIRYINYSVVNRATAEQFVKNGIIRARKDPESLSIISEPIDTIKELSTGQNLYFSLNDFEINNNQIDLNGLMVPVQYVKHQAWIGYRPTMDLVIVDDQTYNKLKEKESTLSLLPLQADRFDYKNKVKVNEVINKIGSVYANSEEKVNFVDIQD